ARPITVTADPKTKVYGEGDPALTYTVGGMGLAPGDTLDLTRAAGEDVGSYAITIAPGPVTGTNYAVSYTGASLAISAAPTMTVLTTAPNPVITGKPVTFTATVSRSPAITGIIPNGSVKFYDGTTVVDTRPLSSTGAATFTMSFSTVGPRNISASYVPAG